MNKYDVLIIGNGIIGNSICYSLLKKDPQIKVGIIGESSRVGSATMAAGAMLNCFAEITSLSLKSEAGKAKFDLGVKALRIWDSWVDSINHNLSKETHIKINPGTFVIHNTKSGQLDSIHYDNIIKALDEYKEPYERIDPKSIPGLNPVDDARSVEAIYLPNEGSINPSSVLQAFRSILENNTNIEFIDDMATKIEGAENKFTVNTRKGIVLNADQVVLAAGSYCQGLLDDIPALKNKIPRIFSGTGYSLVIEQDLTNNIKHVIRSPNRSGACGLHVLPSKEGVYIGASNNVFDVPQELVSAGLAHFLLECALEQINHNFHKSRIISWHVGNRPASIDTYPLIGETSITGLWLVSGTYRDGFHMSPIIAEHIADRIIGGVGLIDHDIFAPERKPLPLLTKNESITEAIEHYMSGAYERSMKLPKAGWDPLFRDLIRDRLSKLYEQLDTDFGLTPDMLMMFEFAEDRQQLINAFKNYLNC
jgi:glycine/D-amino acid oxidase-like deaminating enzyme